MNNCLLCDNCDSEGGYEEGYYGYSCEVRELDKDKRFPYKYTNCNNFKQDNSITSLGNKELSKELWAKVTWEVQ